MPKADPIADAMSRLRAFGANVASPEARTEIQKALASRANILVARGADMVREAKLADFENDLAKAFDRFMVDPTTTDKGCPAKTAIVKALYKLEARVEGLFLTGIHHSQHEGVWGGSSDTAAELRGICALGLVRCNYRDVMIELGDLLMDPEPTCRMMAARAVAYSENEAGLPLLRMKTLAGDPNADVIGECFVAMLRLSARKSVDFVAQYLDSDDEDLKQLAMISLGESRLPGALNALIEQFHRSITGNERTPLLLPIALSRLPASVDFLIRVIGEEHKQLAIVAIDALKMYRSDVGIVTRIRETVQKRDDAEIRQACDSAIQSLGE